MVYDSRAGIVLFGVAPTRARLAMVLIARDDQGCSEALAQAVHRGLHQAPAALAPRVVVALHALIAVLCRRSVLPLAARPAGSQTQTGACAPSTFSTVRSSEAVCTARSPQAEPARRAWMNMPMITIMARRPLTVSATRFLVFAAGSEEVGTLKLKSPLEAACPGPGPARSRRRPCRQGSDPSPRPAPWRWRPGRSAHP